MKIELLLEGLNCAGCAADISEKSKKIPGVKNSNVDIVSKKFTMEIEDQYNEAEIRAKAKELVNKIEPNVTIIDKLEEKNSHGHDHHHHGAFGKWDYFRIGLGLLIVFISKFILKLEGSEEFIGFFLAYILISYDIILGAIRGLINRKPLDELFLMTIATFGAFVIGEYLEAIAVTFLYQIGEYFQSKAVDRSRHSISELMNIKPDYANLVLGDKTVEVDPEVVEIGSVVLVKPGEYIPLDGIVIEGESFLDTANITGESVLKRVSIGDKVYSGTVNHEGVLRIETVKSYGDSTIAKILDLVESSSARKAPTENFITKFARYYTPIVVIIAIGLALIPGLFFKEDFTSWIYRACVFLVISCPCALIISVPLGFFSGIGAAAREGILVKGGNYLEALKNLDTIVFDKTGTITKGVFKVVNIESREGYSSDTILELAAYGEVYSNHPIGQSIREEYGKEIDENQVSEYKEIKGQGIVCQVRGDEILLGNERMMTNNKIDYKKMESLGSLVYIAKNKVHIGTIEISDELKEGIKEDIEDLRSKGIKETFMLSGDKEDVVKKTLELVGIDKGYGDLLPEDKVSILEKIIDGKTSKGKTAFVGDGANDAPVLARADVGIAMGGLGSDASIEAADVVILTDEISKIPVSIEIAKKTNKIVVQNMVLALSVKLIALALGASGYAAMWQAIFADVGVTILAVLNSIRAMRR